MRQRGWLDSENARYRATRVDSCSARPRRVHSTLVTSGSQPRSRIWLVGIICGVLLAIAPLFGPLGYTVQFIGDFVAERPQAISDKMDFGFTAELVALVGCPVGLLLLTISLMLFLRSGRRVV